MKLQAALLLSLIHLADAKPIAVVNSGFEADEIAGPDAPVFSVRPTAPTGWTYVPGVAGTCGLLAPKASDSREQKDFYTAAIPGYEGSHVCFFYKNGAIQQTLDAKLEANTIYTLSVASGTRLKGAFGGYTIKLETASGALVGSWTGVNHNIARPGNFANTTRSFTTGPTPPGLGEALRITLAQGNGEAGGDDYADLDNVRLTAESAVPRPNNVPIDVFFVAGQSNAHGWDANAAALSPTNRHYADTPDPRAMLAYRERNLPEAFDNVGSPGVLGVQGAGFGGYFSGFGPELSAGSDLATGLNGRVAMIKYAIGSAGLEQNFLKSGPTGKPHYEMMLGHLRDSLAELRKQGFEPHLKALFWLQGETDSGTDAAGRYGANTTRFIADLRADLEAPELQFFLTEINGQMPALKPRPGTAQVNAGMEAVATADPKVHFIRTSDIASGFANAIHYSADQAIDIGQRWAKAYLQR